MPTQSYQIHAVMLHLLRPVDLAVLTIWLTAITIVVLTLAFIVPPLYRAGLTQMRIWLTPDHPETGR